MSTHTHISARGRHRATRGWRLRATALTIAAASAAAGLSIPLTAPPASAAEINDAITDVNLVETSISSGTSTMRLEIDFMIGAGIERENGTAKGGDTFWVKMDPRLSSPNGTFDVWDSVNGTEKVASVTMVGGSLATFTLTDYVNNRSFTEGSAFWGVYFRDSTIAAGDYSLHFETAVDDYYEPLRVISTHVPGNGGTNPPLMTGVWQDFDQQNGTLKVMLPNGPASTLVFESFGWTTGPEWKFDCGRFLTGQYAYRNLVGSTVQEVSFECRDDYLRWELANVPEYASTNNVPTMSVDIDVVDPSRSGDLVFRASGRYTINDDASRGLSFNLRQTRGGGALGPTTPRPPIVVPSSCVAGTATDPNISLPGNGSGVTYSMNVTDYEAGDTVEIIADLSSGYEWDSPMPDGWVIVSDTIATLEIVLADSPDCSLSPIDPIVAPTGCLDGTVIDPTITAATTAGITYTLDPVDYGPGDDVDVLATLDSADHAWDSPLPAGWTLRSPTVAVFTVTLGDPVCPVAVQPMAPTVDQTSCAGAAVVLPLVDPANDTAGIRYETIGSVEPGSDVQVLATLTGSAFEWDDDLPTGWVLESPTVASFAITLDAASCLVPGPTGETLPFTGLSDGVLPGSIAAGSILSLLGLALILARAKRRELKS